MVSLAASGTDYAPATSGSSILYGDSAGGFLNVTIGSGLSFTTGTLTATGGGGTVTTTGSPATGNLSKFSGATSITNGDLSGDVTTSGALATTIANEAVTFAKFQNITDARLLGRNAGSSGDMQEITLGTNLSFTGTTLNATSGGGAGTVTSITATSPIVVTPTPLTDTGAVSLDKTVDLAMTAAQSISLSNAATAVPSNVLTLGHNSTATATTGFGTTLLFLAEDTTTNNVNLAALVAEWTTATHNSNVSKILLAELTNGGTSLATPATLTGAGIFDVASGFKIATTAPSGRILQGDGTKYSQSTPTWPTAAVGAGKVVMSDGTNLAMSTPTYPTAAGTAGYLVRSDGTNFTFYTRTSKPIPRPPTNHLAPVTFIWLEAVAWWQRAISSRKANTVACSTW